MDEFSLRKGECPPLRLNGREVPSSPTAKHFDKKLTWREHIPIKRTQCVLLVQMLCWFLGRRCQLCLRHKITVYKALIRPTIFGTFRKSDRPAIKRRYNYAVSEYTADDRDCTVVHRQ